MMYFTYRDDRLKFEDAEPFYRFIQAETFKDLLSYIPPFEIYAYLKKDEACWIPYEVFNWKTQEWERVPRWNFFHEDPSTIKAFQDRQGKIIVTQIFFESALREKGEL